MQVKELIEYLDYQGDPELVIMIEQNGKLCEANVVSRGVTLPPDFADRDSDWEKAIPMIFIGKHG